MSMLHFSQLVERAKKRLEKSTSLVEPVMISTSCSHVLFLHEHIHLLEEQLGASQNLAKEWELEAKKSAALLKAITDLAAKNGLVFDIEQLQEVARLYKQ